ncbi:MAG: methionyl-tRNA formyltransferase [Clostridia bacterium]|nr:methionyl-tRNA formyltransferase [Clostridia bacterium]
MRVVFMGTPDFAVPTLERLIEKHEVVGVFTQPDKPKGRHMTLTPSDVKVCATEHNIPVYQPESLKHGEAMPILNDLQPDVIVVAAYGQILKSDVLDFPKYGCINAHGSILPKYRGAAPIQRAVIDGEQYAGVTSMQMGEGLDTGDMLIIKKVEIGENETAGELFDRLAALAADVIEETLDNIESIVPQKQDDNLSSYARMLSKDECPIDWTRDAQTIHNQIRGLNPWPTATTEQNSVIFKVHMSHLTSRTTDKAPGTITVDKGQLFVATGDGKELEITELQPQGGKRMPVADYLRGHTLEGVFE